MTKGDIQNCAAWTREASWWLEHTVWRALQHRTPDPPTGRTLDATGPPALADPTGNRATARIDANNYLTQAQAHLAKAVTDCYEACQTITEWAGRIQRSTRPEPEPDGPWKPVRCSYCNVDWRAPGRGGACTLCAQWLDRNRHTDGGRPSRVPDAVIEKRLRERLFLLLANALGPANGVRLTFKPPVPHRPRTP